MMRRAGRVLFAGASLLTASVAYSHSDPSDLNRIYNSLALSKISHEKGICGLNGECDCGKDDDTWTNKPEIVRKRRSVEPVIDVSLVNFIASKLRELRLKKGTFDGRDVEEILSQPQEVDAYSRQLYTKKKNIVHIRTASDFISIDGEVAVVAITRGSNPLIAKKSVENLTEVQKSDTKGFTYYIIDDETPESACKLLQKLLETDIPSVYDPSKYETLMKQTSHKQGSSIHDLDIDSAQLDASSVGSAIPVTFVADRVSLTHNKYVVGASENVTSTSESSSLLPLDQFTYLTLPKPEEISTFLDDFRHGGLLSTLMGETPPPGNRDPVTPALYKVVASTWRQLVLDPKTDFLLDSYLPHCPMCMCLAPRVRSVALLADRFLPHVRVGVFDADANDRPHEWTPEASFPALQLFVGKADDNRNTVGYAKAAGPTCSVPSGVVEFPNLKKHQHNEEIERKLFSLDGEAKTHHHKVLGCVPAVDFTHPTIPGKMALPTVLELVNWIGKRSSRPFDPNLVLIPSEFVINDGDKYKSFLPAEWNDVDVMNPAGWKEKYSKKALIHEALKSVDFSAAKLVPMTSLLLDMDKEVQVLETAVFENFYYSQLVNLFAEATGIKKPDAIVASYKCPYSGKDLNLDLTPRRLSEFAHNKATVCDELRRRKEEEKHNSGDKSECKKSTCDKKKCNSSKKCTSKDVDVSTFVDSQTKQRYEEMKACTDRLEWLATKAASYGAGALAAKTIEQCDQANEEFSIAPTAKKMYARKQTAKLMAEALPIAADLVKDEIQRKAKKLM